MHRKSNKQIKIGNFNKLIKLLTVQLILRNLLSIKYINKPA